MVNNTVRWELKLEAGGSQIVVKLRNEHAQISGNESQHLVIKDVRTSAFRCL